MWYELPNPPKGHPEWFFVPPFGWEQNMNLTSSIAVPFTSTECLNLAHHESYQDCQSEYDPLDYLILTGVKAFLRYISHGGFFSEPRWYCRKPSPFFKERITEACRFMVQNFELVTLVASACFNIVKYFQRCAASAFQTWFYYVLCALSVGSEGEWESTKCSPLF